MVITSCVAAGCGRHGMPLPACKNPTSQLYSWAWHWQRMLHWRTNSVVRRSSRSVDMIQWYSFGLSSSWPGDGACLRYGSSYSVFGLETASHYYPWCVCNRSTNFGVSRTFLYRLIGQHLSDASRDLATLTFDLGSHCACRWCGSWCSVYVPSLKFVGLPVRKIWRTSGLNISRPGDLDLWPWIWGALLLVEWTIFLPILVFLGRFVSRYLTLR